MALLVPDAGELQLLTMALKKATVETQTLKLFVSNTTPAEGDTAGTYTEMSTLGYAAITLVRANWTVATVTGTTTADYPQQTFTFTAGSAVNVYGYYIIETTSGVLLWAERFSDGPYPIANTGDQIKITPKISLE